MLGARLGKISCNQREDVQACRCIRRLKVNFLFKQCAGYMTKTCTARTSNVTFNF